MDGGTGGIELVGAEEAGWGFRTKSAAETFALGLALADLLSPGDVVLLAGELGTGKTSFAQGIARGMGIAEQVTSPTFTLMREYQGRMPLYHIDAYRMDGPLDLYDIGVDEYMEGEAVLVVEWGERVRDFFGSDYLEVRLGFADGEDERQVCFLPHGGTWQRRLQGMQAGGDRHAQR